MRDPNTDQIKAAAGVPRNETALASLGLIFTVSLIELCLVKLAWVILGYPAGLPFIRKLVPWSEIASCDLITLYDPSGREVCFVPVFKNQAGEVLSKLNLAQVPLIDQARIARFINLKLPVRRAAVDDVGGIAKKNATKDAGHDRGGRVLRRSETSEYSL